MEPPSETEFIGMLINDRRPGFQNLEAPTVGMASGLGYGWRIWVRAMLTHIYMRCGCCKCQFGGMAQATLMQLSAQRSHQLLPQIWSLSTNVLLSSWTSPCVCVTNLLVSSITSRSHKSRPFEFKKMNWICWCNRVICSMPVVGQVPRPRFIICFLLNGRVS